VTQVPACFFYSVRGYDTQSSIWRICRFRDRHLFPNLSGHPRDEFFLSWGYVLVIDVFSFFPFLMGGFMELILTFFLFTFFFS